MSCENGAWQVFQFDFFFNINHDSGSHSLNVLIFHDVAHANYLIEFHFLFDLASLIVIECMVCIYRVSSIPLNIAIITTGSSTFGNRFGTSYAEQHSMVQYSFLSYKLFDF